MIDGYYWVRWIDGGDWTVARFEDAQWFLSGMPGTLPAPDEIGERIERREPLDAPDLIEREAFAMAAHFGFGGLAWEHGREEMREQWRRRVAWAMSRYLGRHDEFEVYVEGKVDEYIEDVLLHGDTPDGGPKGLLSLLREGEPIKAADIQKHTIDLSRSQDAYVVADYKQIMTVPVEARVTMVSDDGETLVITAEWEDEK